MNLKTNSQLQDGRYVLNEVLGQGGFGITYLATDTKTGSQVCVKEFFIKTLCCRDGATPEVTAVSDGACEMVEAYKEKFVKEAQIVSGLDSPHVIRILDVFLENGTAYYVMELMRGGSLKQYVDEHGPLRETEALGIVSQVCDALDCIHKHSIMHLDVKPANIMLRDKDDKDVALIDFGISKRYDSEGDQTSSTPVGISCGFAPLEQYNNGGVRKFSPATDIYSLGATLYFLLTGSVPPSAEDVMEYGAPDMPKAVSARTRKAIKRAMSPRKQDRPQTIAAFEKMLDIYVEDNVVVPDACGDRLVGKKWRWLYWLFFPLLLFADPAVDKRKTLLSVLVNPIVWFAAYMFFVLTAGKYVDNTELFIAEAISCSGFLLFAISLFFDKPYGKGDALVIGLMLAASMLFSFGLSFIMYVLLVFMMSLLVGGWCLLAKPKWDGDEVRGIVGKTMLVSSVIVATCSMMLLVFLILADS